MKQMKGKHFYHILMALKDKLLLRTSIIVLTMYCVIIAYVKLKCMTKLAPGMGGRNEDYTAVNFSHYA